MTDKDDLKRIDTISHTIKTVLSSIIPTTIGGRISKPIIFKDDRNNAGPPVVGAKMVEIGGRPSTIPDMEAEGEQSPRMNETQLPVEEFLKVQQRCVELEEAYRSLKRIDNGSDTGKRKADELSKTLGNYILRDEEVGPIVNYAYRAGERNAAALVLNKFIDIIDNNTSYSIYELVHALLEAKLILPNTTITENKERLWALVKSFRNTKRPIDEIAEQIIFDLEPELEVIYKSNYVTTKKRTEWFLNFLASVENERITAQNQTKKRRDKRARKAASLLTKSR